MMFKLLNQDFSEFKFYWVIPLTVWLLLYIFRPFVLGFYSDDWFVLLLPLRDGTVFSPARLNYLIELYSNRPLTGLFTYILSLFCNGSEFLWHTAIMFVNLATTFFIRLFIRRFLILINSNLLIIAEIVACFWLAFPWTLGFTAWPTLVPCQIAIIFFSYSGICLFTSWKKGKISSWKPSLFFLLSCLSYESFYGQFIIFIALGLIYGIHKRLGWKAILYPLVSYIIVQFLAIAWNRLSPILFQGTAATKSLYKHWYVTWFNSVVNLPTILSQSTSIFKNYLIYLLSIGLIIFAISLVFYGNQGRMIQEKIQLFLTILVFSIGGLLAIAVYCSAGPGYSMASVGLASRVTLSLSFWLAMILVPMYLILFKLPLKLKLSMAIVTLGIIICLGGATLIQIQPWAKAWEIQKIMLSSVPIQEISKINRKAYLILTNSPQEYQGISIFNAPWDFDAAMKYTYPNVKEMKFLVDAESVKTSWDGDILEQTVPLAWSFKYATKEVWIWNYQTKNLLQVFPPLKLDHAQ